MRFPKTLILLAFVAAIALSVAYGKQTEGFMNAGGIAGLVLFGIFILAMIGFAFYSGSSKGGNNNANFAKRAVNTLY